MKYLIVCRHGSYVRNTGALTPNGRAQIATIGTFLLEKLKDLTIVIASSDLPRAMESAEILRPLLGGPVVHGHRALNPDSNDEDPTEAVRLIKEYAPVTDAVVVVTHQPFSGKLPYRYAKEALGVELSNCFRLDVGEAHILDCEAKTIELWQG